MKKLNKLFAILIAVLGVSTLSAQTNIIADWDGGSNTGKPTTFGWASSNSGRSWGELNGGGARVTTTYNGYTLENGNSYSYNANSELSSKILWIRYANTSETYTYTFTGLEAGKVYTFSGLVGWHNNSNAPTFTITVNGDKELAKVSKSISAKQKLYPFSVDFMVPADNQSTNFTLTFKSNQGNDNMEALSALSIVENTAIANASQESPYDMTSWLKDAGFEEATGGAGTVNTPPGWTIKHNLSGWLDGTPNTTNPSEGSKCYNIWAGTVNSIDMYQTVTLPAGKYTVYADLRTDGVDKITNQGVYANVGGVITKSGTIQTVASKWNSLEGWNTLTTTFNNANAGEVTIGISSTGNGGSSGWFQVDNVRLLYYGYDLSEALNALNALVATAQGVIDANEVSPQSVLSLQAAIEAANSVQQTEEAIAEASTALTEAINAANATIAACNEYKSMLAISESMYTNSTADDKSTFEAAINKAKSDFNAATSIDAISAIVTDLQNAQKAYCLVAAPTEGHPFDMTWLVVNPNFDVNTDGWAYNTNAGNHGRATNQGGAITGGFFENWDWNSYKGEIFQELTGLPKGKYVLTAAAFRDQLIEGASDGDAVYVFANEAETLVDAATPAFYSIEVTTTTGTLTFGVRSKVAKYRWMGIDNVTLQFVAGLDLSEFTAAYSAALEAAIAARDNVEYSKVGGAEKVALLAAIAMTPEQTQESLNNATDALVSATSAFTAAKGDYDKLSAEIVVAEGLGMTDDQIISVTSGKTGSVAYNDLKVEEYEFVMDSYSESVQLGNWTSTFDNIGGQSYDGSDTKYYDKWGDGTFDLKQSVTLPAGDYAVSVIARGQSGASGTLYYKIGDATTSTSLIMKGDSGLGVDVNGVANFAEGGSYSNNNAGRGWEYRFITFHLDAETSVEIGVTASVSWQWASAYAPMLYTTEASQKVLLLDEINTLLSDVPSGKMGAAVAAALESAVSAAEGVSNATELSMLSEVASDLRSAVADAKASISGYAKLEGYISMTKVFTDVTQYEQKYENGEFATDEVETVRQELNVMRYNAASAMFTNKVDVTGWTGTMGEMSNEHWSGTTVSYKDANSWNDTEPDALTTQISLPKGNYVLKVAGRCSEQNATLTLRVLDQSITFHGKGAYGRGIDVNGNANFSDEGTYARNGEGYGWEWEFLKFSLDAEQTVTLEVNSSYNNTMYVWNSFGDITLWMDDETYVTVNGGAINAPLAAAKALVDTKPMGVAEKTALQNAIAQAEGTISTPAELDGAIAALETAVANANQWVVAYNEAKAPLVAALERFEADYNDAQNGALNHMNKDRWATAVEMAQAAAVAKDVTDSYDGFESVAGNLNSALDAATVSINEYASLKAAIDEANTLYAANVGDGPFQRSESAINGLGITSAQNVYDEATADGKGVTSVTEALKNGLKGIVLNAPADGQRFNIVMDYEGWEHHGKAATYLANDRNDAGNYNIKYYAAPNKNYAQAFTFTAVEGLADCYTLSMTDVDGNERYVCTGTVYEGNSSQIRTTTDASKALAVKVIATATDGVHQLWNTEANNYLGGQDAGFYTVNSHTTFRLQEAAKANVTLTISSAGWATLILPFNAKLPDEVKAYSCDEADGKVLTLQEAGSLVANTPYLMNGQARTHDFSGYGLADKDSYTVGLFTGTYVEYQTTANSNTYVLQNHDGEVAFYLVGNSNQPKVGAYRCYMTYEGAAGAPMFSFGRGEGTTAIDNAQSTVDAPVIYDLMGRKVSAMEKGNMYIVNGQKVVVK